MNDHDMTASSQDAAMVGTFEMTMRAEQSPQNSGDAFCPSTGCFSSLGGSAAAGSEALNALGQAEPVLNAATRDGVGRPATRCASCRSQKRKCAPECPGRLDPAGAQTPLLAAAHASAQLGSGADEVTPVGVPVPNAAQADPSIADSAGLTERADGKRTRVRRDLHGEAPECAALRDKASGPKRTRHFGSELAALPEEEVSAKVGEGEEGGGGGGEEEGEGEGKGEGEGA